MSMVTVAGVLLFNALGQVLLIRQNYGGRYYSLPGGVIEAGETPQHAAIRETLEETCLEVGIERLIGMYSFEAQTPFLAFVFLGTVVRGKPVVPPTGEIAELAWFDPSALPAPLYSTAHHAIGDALQGVYGVVREIRG